MPGRRKKTVENGVGGDAAAVERKVKEEEEEQVVSNGSGEGEGSVDLTWEWQADGGVWTPFSKADVTQINNALQRGQQEVTMTANNKVKFTVRFARMVQKNKTTGWERAIRCAVVDADDNAGYVWQWQDGGGAWREHTAAATTALERARRHAGDDDGGATVAVDLPKRSFVADVRAMAQTDTRSQETHAIHRVKSETPNHTVNTQPPVQPASKQTSLPSTRSARKGRNDGDAEDPPVPKKAKSSKMADRVKKEEAGDVEESKHPPVPKKAKSSKMADRVKKEEAGDVEESKLKTVVIKGKAPMDAECTEKLGKAHVYYESNDVYDAMLNQTNLQANNNKYYLMQLLEDDSQRSYSVWFRWGRVGKKGQSALVPCGPDLREAKDVFTRKFTDKTKNEWSERRSFVKVAGKYDLLKMDYSSGSVEKEAKSAAAKRKGAPPRKEVASRLDEKLRVLVELICDVRAMEEAMLEMQYDCKKSPLGKLTKDQIKAGYQALKNVDKLIRKGQTTGSAIVQACNDFYTRIPHDFGMRQPPIIRTQEILKAKLSLLEALADIEVAIRNLQKSADDALHPADQKYRSLSCGLTILKPTSDEYSLIKRYLLNTHAPTHSLYRMRLLDVFEVNKDEEAENMKPDVGNRMLLWHGSRLTNWAGILSQGLKIAPPEAPVTGYMFGKGIYFADISSKSANYCYANRTHDEGVLVLCEVALGECNELLVADYEADKLPEGKHSVKGLGSVAPDPKDNCLTEEGVTVPTGEPVASGVKNPAGYTLNYNEYVVYSTAQVRMRYLVRVKFLFT